MRSLALATQMGLPADRNADSLNSLQKDNDDESTKSHTGIVKVLGDCENSGQTTIAARTTRQRNHLAHMVNLMEPFAL